jgi:nicotinate phosphoribosyltransferase
MGVSADAPSLDAAYKLVQYDGKGRMKLSAGKATVPGRKQIFRMEDDRDVVALFGEDLPGRPLLEPVMRAGRRMTAISLEQARARAGEERSRLPARLRGLERAEPYRVELSDALAAECGRIRRSLS